MEGRVNACERRNDAAKVLVDRQGNMADSREVMNIRQGQPLAFQKVKAGPVDGREVEPDGSGSEA
jgi:hypothetical protein